MLTRRFFLSSALAASLPSFGTNAHAEIWPSRGIKIVVPFGPGGSADVVARFVGNKLQDTLRQNVIVENRTGAAGTIGTNAVAKSDPDGYTLLAISNTITANETLMPNRPYELLRDLRPVASCNIAYNTLVVHPSMQAKTLPDLIELARRKPGALNYASSGVGSVYHIIGESFRTAAGIQVQHIPFRSSDQARTAILSGSVDYLFDAIPTMLETVRGGQVHALATTGPTRDPLMPEVPTIAETLPGFEGAIWIGILAPAGTPDTIVQQINTEVNNILNMPATREWHAKLGSHPMPKTVADFEKFLRSDIDKQRKWIVAANIKAE